MSMAPKGNVFEIVNSQFKFLARISPEYDTQNQQAFVAGVLKGAFCNLGVEPAPQVSIKMISQVQTLFPLLQISIKMERGASKR